MKQWWQNNAEHGIGSPGTSGANQEGTFAFRLWKAVAVAAEGGCGRRLRKAAAVVLECLQRLDVDPRLKPSQRLKKLIQKFQQMSLEFQQSLQKLTAPAGAVMCHEAKFSEHTCQRYSEIEKARCFVDHVRLEDWLCQPCLHGKLLPWCFRKTKIPRVSWLSLPTWQVEIL